MPDSVMKTYGLQVLCMGIIINNEQKNVLMPACVTKTYGLQLLCM
jgi:hypothetical protein